MPGGWTPPNRPDAFAADARRAAHAHESDSHGHGVARDERLPADEQQGVYEGQRGVAPNQRVFILTRSGFAGTQRYAAATWSGDVSSTWTALQKQIPAGLGFSLSGVPYWTTTVAVTPWNRGSRRRTRNPKTRRNGAS